MFGSSPAVDAVYPPSGNFESTKRYLIRLIFCPILRRWTRRRTARCALGWTLSFTVKPWVICSKFQLRAMAGLSQVW